MERYGDHNFFRVFARCNICGCEIPIEFTTREIEQVRKNISKSYRTIRREIERHGAASSATVRSSDRLVVRKGVLLAELNEKLREAGLELVLN